MAAKSMNLSLSPASGHPRIDDFHGSPGSRYRFSRLMPLQTLLAVATCYTAAATALGLEERRDMKRN
jgi:hypothetical protein